MMNSNKTAKILVVEDSPTQAERLKFILEEEGYQVTLAADGMQALICLEGYQPELIISDIVMPKMNGYELCKQIKSDQRTREITVLLMTTFSDIEDVHKAVDCGADSFITKPYSKDYLFVQIKRVMAAKSLRQSEEANNNIEINLNYEHGIITIDPQRLFGLLLSTYEAAMYQNSELNKTLEEISALINQLSSLNNEKMAKLAAEVVERQRVQMMQANSERLRKLIDADFNNNLIVDRDGIIQYVNSNTEKLFHQSYDELVGRKLGFPILTQNVEQMINTPEGYSYLVEMRFVELEWEGQMTKYVSLHDITDHKQAEILLRKKTEALETEIAAREKLQVELYSLSLHDELTGLYNRRGFLLFAEQQWLQALRRKEQFVILYADIDNLKYINDTYGHSTGDGCLHEISDIIKRTLRASDVMARIGGDEFTALLVNCSQESARILVNRLKDNLKKKVLIKSRDYPLSLSVGMAHFDPSEQESIDDLLKRADKEMYACKQRAKRGTEYEA